MKYYIALDGGTSNTRVSLYSEGRVLNTVRLSVGARANGEEKGVLDRAVKQAIDSLLRAYKLKESDVQAILGSGMLTSEMGLYCVPHLLAPVGVAELHKGITRVMLPSISPIPFFLVPGVKTVGDLASTDLMRGEETELYGLFDAPPKNAVVILPGSHSKIIQTDGEGRIVSFKTMLTGELLAAVSTHTVLGSSITLSEGELVKNALFDGYRYTELHGVNEALFKVRVARLSLGVSHNEAYSFLLGTVLHDEIKAVLALAPGAVYIGGRRQIKEATAILLSELFSLNVLMASDEAVGESTAKGLVKIYEYTDR